MTCSLRALSRKSAIGVSAVVALSWVCASSSFAASDAKESPEVAVVRDLLRQDSAVGSTGYRLATANVDLCAEHMIESGMLVETLAQYGADYRPAAVEVLHITERPTVAWVMPGGPAARAGVMAGDVLITADGAPFAATPPRSANGVFAPVATAMNTLDAALAKGDARLTIERAGQQMTVDVIGVASCKARFQLLAGGSADATSDGTWIQLSTKMADMAQSPDELAAVLAHELAHNALGHRRADPSVQRRQELAADRLMPYLMQRAGFEPSAAVTLYQRFKQISFGGILPSATHPGWSIRARAVAAEVDRIAALKASGSPVVRPADLDQK